MRFIRRSVTPSQVEINFPAESNMSTVQDKFDSRMAVKDLQQFMRNKSDLSSSEITCRFNQVAEYLFLGNVEAAYSEPLLCRYRIASLVDVSALHPNQIGRQRRSICPCTCPLQTAHCRAKLTVCIEDKVDEEIVPFLQEINTFIHSHRVQQRNVLVFSNAGLCRAPTIIAQYLIQFEGQNLKLILANMMSLLPDMDINASFRKVLRKIERKAARKRTVSPVWNIVPLPLRAAKANWF